MNRPVTIPVIAGYYALRSGYYMVLRDLDNAVIETYSPGVSLMEVKRRAEEDRREREVQVLHAVGLNMHEAGGMLIHDGVALLLWHFKGMAFHIELDDVHSPLTVRRSTGSLALLRSTARRAGEWERLTGLSWTADMEGACAAAEVAR